MELPINTVLSHFHLPPSTPETINPILDLLEAHNDQGAMDLISSLYPRLYAGDKFQLKDFLKELINPVHTYDFLLIDGKVYRTDVTINPDPTQTDWATLTFTQFYISWYPINIDIDSISSTPEFLAYYNQRLQATDLYQCGVNGTCQRTFGGIPLVECQAICEKGRLIPDLHYKVLSYAPDSALQLPLNDQQRVVRDIVGYTIPLVKVTPALEALTRGRWSELSQIPELTPYLKTKYGVVEYWLRTITWLLNLKPRAINYQVLSEPFIELVRQFRIDDNRFSFIHQVLGLFYDTLHLDEIVSLADLDPTEDDEVDVVSEKGRLQQLYNIIYYDAGVLFVDII